MVEHTPTPWRVEEGTGLVWGDCTLFDDGTPDRLGVPVTDGQLERPWAQGKGPSYDEMEANAAFIVKAVNNHEKLLEFFKWAMREGPWDGGDLDGGSVQDKAEALGLIVKTQYNAEKHGVQSDFETGDDWFEYAPDLRAPLIPPRHT
jgi:hypothetical protein